MNNDSAQDQLPNPVNLPPNVVFQPKESEPFAFEGIMPLKDQNLNAKSDEGMLKQFAFLFNRNKNTHRRSCASFVK